MKLVYLALALCGTLLLVTLASCTREDDKVLAERYLEQKYGGDFIAYECNMLADGPIPFDYDEAICCAPASDPDCIFQVTMFSHGRTEYTFLDNYAHGALNREMAAVFAGCLEGEVFPQFYVTAQCLGENVPMPEQGFDLAAYLQENPGILTTVRFSLAVNDDSVTARDCAAEHQQITDAMRDMAALTGATVELDVRFAPEELYERMETWYTGHHLPSFRMDYEDYYYDRNTKKGEIPKQFFWIRYWQDDNTFKNVAGSEEPFTLDDYTTKRQAPLTAN